MMNKPPLEFSEDRHRGMMPHISAVIDQLRGLSGTRCAACGRPASHLIDTQHMPRAACGRCADEWVTAAPLERRQMRQAFATRTL